MPKAKMTFEQWKTLVNQHINHMCGMFADDLPDYDYWRDWNNGVTARVAAFRAINAAKDY